MTRREIQTFGCPLFEQSGAVSLARMGDRINRSRGRNGAERPIPCAEVIRAGTVRLIGGISKDEAVKGSDGEFSATVHRFQVAVNHATLRRMEYAMTIAKYSFTVDAELMKRFEELAGPANGDGADILRSFMAYYVETLDADDSYNTWLRAKVRSSMATARAGGLVDNEDVEAEFSARRDASHARLAAQ